MCGLRSKLKIDENEMHFHYLVLIYFQKERKKNTLFKQQKMVCVIYGDDIITAENTVSGLLGSEMEILIRKIENFPAGMQSLMMIKSKH